MQAAGGNKRKVRVVRPALPRFRRPLEVIEDPVDTMPDRLGEFRGIRESNERISVAAYIPYAAMSETSSNCWKLSVINEASCWEYLVDKPSRTSWMAA